MEGFSFFCDFRKWTYCCWLVIFLWVQFQKIRKYIIFAWPSFHYQKIILLQRKIAKKKIWEKISFFQFYFRPPKWAKRFLTWSKEFLNKLRNKFCFRCNLHKCKIKKYFFAYFRVTGKIVSGTLRTSTKWKSNRSKQTFGFGVPEQSSSTWHDDMCPKSCLKINPPYCRCVE